MELLSKPEIIQSLDSDESDSLFIDPLLDKQQVGEVTLDLRLGYDFLVSILTRKPFIEIANSTRSIRSYFQQTRRDLGERFILYPNQVVLTTTFEYLSLPSYVYADILTRSSYTRLGIHINTMVQPGFRGSVPIELFNHSNNAVELVVGSRLFQARLFRTGEDSKNYLGEANRKYYGHVRPVPSKADNDEDLQLLDQLRESKQ